MFEIGGCLINYILKIAQGCQNGTRADSSTTHPQLSFKAKKSHLYATLRLGHFWGVFYLTIMRMLRYGRDTFAEGMQ